MTKEAYAETHMWEEKKTGLLRKENKIAGGFVIAAFVFANTTLSALFLSEGRDYSIPSFILDILICSGLILAAFHIPFRIMRRGKEKIFDLREIGSVPCYIEFCEEYFRYCVDGAEDKIPYDKIKFIKEGKNAFSLILKESHECISIPKTALSEEVLDDVYRVLSEKASDRFDF